MCKAVVVACASTVQQLHLLDDDVTVFLYDSLPRLLFVSVRGCLAQAAVAASIFLPIAVTKYIKQLSIGKISVL
jgi:hypothetical protein